MRGTAMAEIPMPEDAPQRYAELERAYVEERWSSVSGSGEALLEELDQSDDPEAEALANRVHVLMGHAHLYGLAEASVAEDHYRAVLSGNAEAELRRLAAEGLQQCQRPPAPRNSASDAATAEPTPTERPAEPAVEPEPAPTTAPSTSESPTQSPTQSPSGSPMPAPGESPSATAAGVGEADIAAETGPEVGGRVRLEKAAPLGEPAGSAIAADPFQAAVAAASSAAAQPASGPAMPWLQDLPSGSVAPMAEPQTHAPALLDTSVAPRVVTPFELQPGGAEPVAAEPDPQGGGGALVPRLEVEVVEEPELLEVAQADPGLAEELELELSRIRERRTATREGGDPFAAAVAAASAEVALNPLAGEPPSDWEAETASDTAAALELEAPTLHATADTVGGSAAAAGAIPAAAPDLSSEDPELVAGLLRVVLSP